MKKEITSLPKISQSTNSIISAGKANSNNQRRSSLPALKMNKSRQTKVKNRKIDVARSDIDEVINQDISFCSFPRPDWNVFVELSPEFESNRIQSFTSQFISKCKQCQIIVDFYSKDKEMINIKSVLLSQLIKSLEVPIYMRSINAEAISELFTTISTNIFRDFPPVTTFPPTLLVDRIESFCDLAWPHLSLSYDLLYRTLTSTYIPAQIMAPFFTTSFLSCLFHCLASPDSRERQSVKTLFFVISNRIPSKSQTILTLISTALIDSISGEPIRWGLPQVLELFINLAQAIPQFINSKFEVMLHQQFMPLHLTSTYPTYSSQLHKCIGLIIDRNPQNVEGCIFFLLNHFPVASQVKQLLFIDEIASILKPFWAKIAPDCSFFLVQRLADLFSSPCASISEKALSCYFEPGFRELIEIHFPIVAPIVLEKAMTILHDHWNEVSIDAAQSLIDEISNLDPELYSRVYLKESQNISLADTMDKSKRSQMWKFLSTQEESCCLVNSFSNPGLSQKSQDIGKRSNSFRKTEVSIERMKKASRINSGTITLSKKQKGK